MPRNTRSPRHLSSSRPLRICTLAGTILCSAHALADDIQWSNTNGGVFSTGANWIGGVVPGAADFARFGRTRTGNPQVTYTVSFGTNPSNQGVVIEDDAVTFDLNGHAYSLTHPSQALSVGTSTSFPGRLTLTDGVVATTPDSLLSIGAATNAPGFLTLTTGAQLLGPATHVGSTGPGTLLVQNGADLVGGRMFVGSQFGAGVTGTATVTGTGSSVVVEDLTVGGIGTGTLNISSGGRVESTNGTLGQGSGVVGTVNVDGMNSRWSSSGSLVVGDSGRGTLNITGGAQVQCQGAWVGFNSGASNSVAVGGNAGLIVESDLTVGFRGSSTMTISGAGEVRCSAMEISVIAPATVTVQGSGSVLNCSDDITVAAGSNSGTFNISDRAEVFSQRGFIGRFSGPGAAVVSGFGSLWMSLQGISIGGDAAINQPGGAALLAIRDSGTVATFAYLSIFPQGSLELSGGTLETPGLRLASGPGGTFLFRGGTLRTNAVEFDLLNQGGRLATGRSDGDLDIDGSYTQQAGTLEIRLRGSTPTMYDHVFVHGDTTVGGSLDVRLVSPHVPSPGDIYVILESASSISGAFANVANGQRLAVTNRAGSIAVHYGPGSRFDPSLIVLSNYEPCPSDFNNDGFIDFFDFNAFIDCFEGIGCPPGQDPDFNDDGFVDFFDADAFLEAFEAGC